MHQPITGEQWNAIQERAKASARIAIKTNNANGLTALGRAYFEKFSQEIK
jgi:hypothetical protein